MDAHRPGWAGYSDTDWHDVGIVYPHPDRPLVVAVLTRGKGSAGVRRLAAALRAALDDAIPPTP